MKKLLLLIFPALFFIFLFTKALPPAFAASCSLSTDPSPYKIDPQSSTQPEVDFTFTTDLRDGSYHIIVGNWPIGGNDRGRGGTSFQATGGRIKVPKAKPFGLVWQGATTYPIKIADTLNSVLCGNMQFQVEQSDIHQYCSFDIKQNTPGDNGFWVRFNRPQSEDPNNKLLNGYSTNNMHRPVLKQITEENNVASEVRDIPLECVTTQQLGNFQSVGNLNEGFYYLQMRAGCDPLRQVGNERPVACDTIFGISSDGGLQAGDSCDPANDLCPIGTSCNETQKVCKIDLAESPDLSCLTCPEGSRYDSSNYRCVDGSGNRVEPMKSESGCRDNKVCIQGSGCVDSTRTGTTPLPCEPYNLAGLGCSAIRTLGLGDIQTDLKGFVGRLLSLILGISGGIVLILIISAGYRLMVSSGNPERVQAAREQLTSAVVGLLFIIFSLVILQVITRDIIGLPGFG